ncbi:hypothetical protein OAU50_00580 [Planctomycetota bacterium]|nr:hypothetical protein [Planctomycetota bacterium]
MFTAAEASGDAEQIAVTLQDISNPVPVDVRVIDLTDPTDHLQIAYGLAKEINILDEEHRLLDQELYVLLNSGTPQMQTIWTLLKSLGLLKFHMIQTVPLKIAHTKNIPVAFESKFDAKMLDRLFVGLVEKQE